MKNATLPQVGGPAAVRERRFQAALTRKDGDVSAAIKYLVRQDADRELTARRGAKLS